MSDFRGDGAALRPRRQWTAVLAVGGSHWTEVERKFIARSVTYNVPWISLDIPGLLNWSG